MLWTFHFGKTGKRPFSVWIQNIILLNIVTLNFIEMRCGSYNELGAKFIHIAFHSILTMLFPFTAGRAENRESNSLFGLKDIFSFLTIDFLSLFKTTQPCVNRSIQFHSKKIEKLFFHFL